MNRIALGILGTVAAVGLMRPTFATPLAMPSTETADIGARTVPIERASGAFCSAVADPGWALALHSGPADAYGSVFARPEASSGMPPQMDGVTYWIVVMLLCYVEEEACFDVCADQAGELEASEALTPDEAREFRAECNQACWNNCDLGGERN